ncbi:MAG: class I SAM-dependent methyltransferase [Acetobacteraceae bacterium]|nr:class I SAM-dependent methyltransferase [Acetobacteraceae bacterium]
MSQPGPPCLFDALSNYLEHGIGQVEGWLSRLSASMAAHLSLEQVRAGLRGDVCEIGVHHGKLFLVLANAIVAGERAFAVDVFSDQEKNLDRSGAGDRAVFERHLAAFAPGAQVEIIQESSLDLERLGFLSNRFRLMSIDGGHTAAVTENDLRLAQATLLPGGIAVLDDVLSPNWTGVVTGLARYLAQGGTLVPFALAPNKLLLASSTADAGRYSAILRRDFPLALSNGNLEFLGATVDSYWEHPYYNREGGAGLTCERDDLRREVEALRRQVSGLQARVAAFHASTSWRVTAPLRSLLGGRRPG